MTITHPEVLDSRQFQGLILPAHPTSGTEDDDDDRDDEHAGENEAAGRAVDEGTEAPEEFEVDDKGNLSHLEDDDTDEEDRSFASNRSNLSSGAQAESCDGRSLVSYGCTLSSGLSARRVYGSAHARACCLGGTRYAYL